ncbi:energy transducer TonB [Psychrobacter urativorans]|uniref:TonB C-terminal domain-containing protein n=1 Tax=Psychrobacter urativorans TaxID=45610 RepID=A0A0M4T3A6_9GAMM|nr:TonB family protein [Psychrobacter urativorans]ALF60240.1 hypothetical protein AOC03_09495 [Psychrobacter urativorans]
MEPTNFNAPPRKLTLIAISGVVGLHVLTAMALVAIKPAPPIDKVMETPPIEIQMITLPVEVQELETVKEKVKLENTPAPTPVSQVIPEAKVAAKPEPVKQKSTSTPITEPKIKPESDIKPKPETKPKPVEKAKPPVAHKRVEEKKPEPIVHQDDLVKETRDIKNNAEAEQALAEKQRQIDAVQNAQRAAEAAAIFDAQKAQEATQAAAQAKAQQDSAMREQQAADAKSAKAAKETAEKAAQEKAAQDKVKADQQAKAAKDAEAAAKAQADAKAKADMTKAEAASNTPVNFSASNANWKSKPNFSFPDRASRGANSGDTFNVVLVLRVNKQGGIDSVRLAQSSGNAILDKEAQRQVRSGKFKPFMNNGAPVVGNVTLPISYAVP